MGNCNADEKRDGKTFDGQVQSSGLNKAQQHAERGRLQGEAAEGRANKCNFPLTVKQPSAPPAYSQSAMQSDISKIQANYISTPMPAALPAGWEELTAPDGRQYYFNSHTNSTTCDRPANVSPSAPPPEAAGPLVVVANSTTIKTGMSACGHPGPINLSGNYEICHAKNGRHASAGKCTQIGNRWRYSWRNGMFSGSGSGTVEGSTAYGDNTGNTGHITGHRGCYEVNWSNGYTWCQK